MFDETFWKKKINKMNYLMNRLIIFDEIVLMVKFYTEVKIAFFLVPLADVAFLKFRIMLLNKEYMVL